MRKAVREERTGRKTNKKVTPKNKKMIFNIKLDKKQKTTLIIGFIIVALIIAVNNYTSLGLVLNKNINSDDALQIELQTSNNKIIPFDNEILVYNKGTITSYNNYGRKTGQIRIEDTIEADIYTSGKYIQVINKDKGVVYVYKNKYEVGRIKIDGKINGGIINSEGVSVIEYSSNGNKTELGIYSNSGEKRYNVKLSNKVIGKYILSENSRYLVYVDVNINGISASTNINLIDFSNVKDDAVNAETIHTVDTSLAYDIYWTDKTVIARFENCYMLYNTTFNKKEVIEINDGQIVSIADHSKKYAYTKLDEIGNYELGVGKIGSNNIKIIAIDDAPKYFKYKNGIIYVCYANKIEAYNNLGMKIKSYNSNMVITEPVIFNNGRSVAMGLSNKLIMFTI